MSSKYRCIHREEGNNPVQSRVLVGESIQVRLPQPGETAPSPWQPQRREDLTAVIAEFFDESEQTYGYRRIHAELTRSGVKVSPDTVRRIMAVEGLVA